VINKKTLILGLGNEILTDDGIGPKLVKDLSGMFEDTSMQFKTASCGGLEIMEYVPGFDQAVFIDAIHTRNGKPGDVYYFGPSDLRETSNISNLHDVNFLTALKLAGMLMIDLPSSLHIIAVEIIEDLEFGEGLTDTLNKKYPEILSEVFSLISNIAK
jgi:hydrogenase maturation protease